MANAMLARGALGPAAARGLLLEGTRALRPQRRVGDRRELAARASEGCGANDPAARSAYVHLPFCRRKCFYCDFPVVALGEGATELRVQEPEIYGRYVSTLLREMEHYGGGGKLRTVFFGGGTPSLIPPRHLERVLGRLDDAFGIDWGNAEISMECDPGTFDLQRLVEYRSLGVNRVSVGVQSFDGRLLELCGRSHGEGDVLRALDDVRAAGFDSWSLDLMFGLPHQTAESWAETLEMAVAADPDHVSCYDLQLEDSTPFARWYTEGEGPLPSEPLAADLFRMASRELQGAGYSHYEISNYAREGHECRHNLAYWRDDPFYAFGVGATSSLHGRRVARPKKLSRYEQWVEGEGRKVGFPPPDWSGAPLREDEDERLLDLIMLSLRLKSGLRVNGLNERFGRAGRDVERRVLAAVEGHAAEGLVSVSEGGHAIRLTDPEGLLLSNSVISDIFVALDDDEDGE